MTEIETTPAASTQVEANDLETLEREGDFAADYIETLLDIADLDGDIDIAVRNGRAYVSVAGGDSRLDQLSHPDTVNALQELARLAAQAKSGQYSRLILDIAGSRDARTEDLKQLVDNAIVAIIAGRDEVALEPMSSYERKLVHDFVAERGYFSESRGEGRDRRLVIRKAE
jgi:spoIIIJ-associated protein